MRKLATAGIWLILWAGCVFGQTAPWHQKTLLNDEVIDRFIDEVSGEIAMQHVIEMAAYNRNRMPAEYRDTYLEDRKSVV